MPPNSHRDVIIQNNQNTFLTIYSYDILDAFLEHKTKQNN